MKMRFDKKSFPWFVYVVISIVGGAMTGVGYMQVGSSVHNATVVSSLLPCLVMLMAITRYRTSITSIEFEGEIMRIRKRRTLVSNDVRQCQFYLEPVVGWFIKRQAVIILAPGRFRRCVLVAEEWDNFEALVDYLLERNLLTKHET